MFFGSFTHTLDEKGRLVIPAKMREEAGLKLFIMKGFDGALAIYKKDEFEKLVAQVESLPFNKKVSRDYQRIQLASVTELDVDKAGRVQLPQTLLTKYEIGKDVIVLGVGDHMEVWDAVKYEKYISQVDDDFEKIAENIDPTNI